MKKINSPPSLSPASLQGNSEREQRAMAEINQVLEKYNCRLEAGITILGNNPLVAAPNVVVKAV